MAGRAGTPQGAASVLPFRDPPQPHAEGEWLASSLKKQQLLKTSIT